MSINTKLHTNKQHFLYMINKHYINKLESLFLVFGIGMEKNDERSRMHMGEV